MSRPISISIHGLGGQGGGTLADWLVDLAEHNGCLAQATSIPGVAQRTGSTVYYLELFPRAAAADKARDPVMALMPMPGDVDLVIASELAEAGRAISRGVVTSDRTFLIASSHRVFAISEKSAMADGIVDSEQIHKLCIANARKVICFDMQAVADRHDTIISSTLLGAVAASGVLPFGRAEFEAAIKRAGIGVQGSLKAFAEGFDIALDPPAPMICAQKQRDPVPPESGGRRLENSIRATFPPNVADIATEGAFRCIDYQDTDYARTYLERLSALLQLDREVGDGSLALTCEAARYLALWMCFEDTIRVADLKTRRARFERFRADVKAQADQIVYVVEFMHPRYQELCDTLPHRLGEFLSSSRVGKQILGPLFSKGRFVHTATVAGFLTLYIVSRLKRWRRFTLRFHIEDAEINRWLSTLRDLAPRHYSAAVELSECPRLIKGYGNTRERGVRNFHRIMDLLGKLSFRRDLAVLLRDLKRAAQKDEDGRALDFEIQKYDGLAEADLG